ncbi:MAG: serine protease [Gemmatimonadales bacterium]|nr:MAG: serine protease [Gemmatimonadales bacterium]
MPLSSPPRFGGWLILALAPMVLAGCLRQAPADRPLVPQAFYQTAFPSTDTSDELDQVLSSLVRIRVSWNYETRIFDEATAPLEARLDLPESLMGASDTVQTEQTRAATAILLGHQDGRSIMVTAAHAVNLPDTIVQFYGDGRAVPGGLRRVRSVSILTHRADWVVGLPGLEPFQVLATDDVSDIAIIGVERGGDPLPPGTRPLPVPAGDPDRLSWGSFVYVLGFPAGYPMVTRGIVSDPAGIHTGAFVVDGLWNEGVSGGVILAIRGDGSGMEWVGMARAAAARTEPRLRPTEDALEDREPWEPYEGPLFLEEARHIQYGITLAIPMDAVQRFLDRHRSRLRAEGWTVPIP